MKDLYQEVTNRIIESIEKGVMPWRCPWVKGAAGILPKNHKTGEFYKGINVFLLFMAARENGFTSDQWLTFKQANELGFKVKKGSKSVQCVFFKPYERKEKNAETGEDEIKKRLVIKSFNLFNLDQIEGVERPDLDVLPNKVIPQEEAERIVCASGANIDVGGVRACYIPSLDLIQMPEQSRFHSTEGYYSTLLHELTHWTGHETRLDRRKDADKRGYAFEELVAEIGSTMLMESIGLMDAELENHASYIDHWLKDLEGDKQYIFRAATLASQAFEFLTSQDVAQEKAA